MPWDIISFGAATITKLATRKSAGTVVGEGGAGTAHNFIVSV
jgi:hypothetical protein